MAEQDFAVVVGIDSYSFLNRLRGAENDADLFCEWLTNTNGGDVLDSHISKMKSSDFTDPIGPTPSDIDNLFDPIVRQKKSAAGKVGRRFYVYFAGHGIGKRGNPDESLLLTADAHDMALGKHIPGRVYANAFATSTLFDEVVMFMDCCREVPISSVSLKAFPFLLQQSNREAKRFYGFATKWSQRARESENAETGAFDGIFTRAVLSGLNRGRMTSSQLKDYVLNYLPSLSTAGEEYQEPLIEENDNLVFSENANDAVVEVQFEFSDGQRDFDFTISGSNLEQPIQANPSRNGVTSFPLKYGMYLFQNSNNKIMALEIKGGPLLSYFIG